jgi:predicted peptidase
MPEFTYREARGGLPYALHIPDGAPPEGGWPLIVFLHGSGERGSDGKTQSTVGVGPAILEKPKRWPGIVLMPQCPDGLWWQGTVLDAVYTLLVRTEREFITNPARVILTGLSMGGQGAWNMACAFPDRFAAIAPMCGAADPMEVWKQLSRARIWNVHGDADSLVPVECSRVLEIMLKKSGNRSARFTEYAGVDHNCWDQAYRDAKFVRWVFSSRKK